MSRFLHAILIILCALTPGLVLAQDQDIENPSDPYFEDQWALQQVGAQCAWSYTTGTPDVIVAVVDSGVDMRHPDLVDRLQGGRDFVDGDDDPGDENGHGTNVAGIIAATLDNAQGIVGLSPNVSILPVRVMDREGYGSDWNIGEGIRYAADAGAKVINLSLGATLSIGVDQESAQVSQAIRYAQERGAVVVVAAGNDFVPLPNAIVGSNLDVLVVAATTESDRKAPFSNFGESVNITAPGVHILSTMPTYEVYLTSGEVPEDERFQQDYDYMSGTSQAAPFVSALAALLFSAHPDWSPQQVMQAIKDNAVDISSVNRQLAEQGLLNAGRIDACTSLSNSGAVAQQPVAAPPPQSRLPGGQVRSEPSRALTTAFLGVLVCVGVAFLGVLLLVFGRATRRPSSARATPVYTSAPIPQKQPLPAPVGAVPGAWGTLIVIAGPSQARSYPLVGAETLIGRAPECAISLAGDATVSRRHAIVRNNGQAVTIEDAGSSHGTFLNNQRISGPISVRRGDVLQVGQTLLRFE